MFLEQIQFTSLSESRFRMFINEFDINEISSQLWLNFIECFNSHFDVPSKRILNNSKYKQRIIIGGYNKYNQLGGKSNNISKGGNPIIQPPLNMSFMSPSLILSFSVYSEHSVIISKSGSLYGVGDNRKGRICSSLPKNTINELTEFSIKDINGHKMTPLSAVCTIRSTLYLVTNSENDKKNLILCDEEIRGGDPVFLNIENFQPVALFAGCSHAAAISNDGNILFINSELVKESPDSPIKEVSLPNDEKASFVACCNDFVAVLSSKGHVFYSSIENNLLNFTLVEELSNQEIVWISGTYKHFFAVTKNGRVFGYGSNSDGRLALGENINNVSSFTEISSLKGYMITAAYAGASHSFFQTNEGKIIACGHNRCSELLFSTGSGENVFLPALTSITEGATFCIVGDCLSTVFTGNKLPPNMPNIKVI